jgi:hypothetical protein
MDADKSVQATFGVPPSAYFLFDTAVTSDGHLGEQGGREGADAMCAADADRPKDAAGDLICTYYWAFISVNANDQVLNFPNTIPGRSGYAWNPNANWYFRDGTHGGKIAATDFSGLLDGNVYNDPAAGGIDGIYYWTGSSPTGATASTCHGWDSGEPTIKGHKGIYSSSDSSFLSLFDQYCAGFYNLFCACF